MGDPLDYSQLVNGLKNASLFEVYRLRIALDNELNNPAKIQAVRQLFKEGDTIEYFQAETNTFISAIVMQKHLKYVSVINCHDKHPWRIPYYMININSRDIVFDRYKEGLTKNSIKVGDLLGFNCDGQQIVGRVERLNQKTVSLITPNRHRWRVSYHLLHSVIESTSEEIQSLEHISQ